MNWLWRRKKHPPANPRPPHSAADRSVRGRDGEADSSTSDDCLRRGHLKRGGFRGQDQQRPLDGGSAIADREFDRPLARKWIRYHLKQYARLAAAWNDGGRHLQSGAAAGKGDCPLPGGPPASRCTSHTVLPPPVTRFSRHESATGLRPRIGMDLTAEASLVNTRSEATSS